MRYTTTGPKARVVHHEHEPWATECGRDTTDVAHEITPEALAAAIAAGTLRMCKSCERVHAARNAAPAPAAPVVVTVATNAFEQAAMGLHDARPAGRYALQVCEDPRDVCERDACTGHSTRAAGTLDEVRQAAGMFRHAWAVDSNGNRIALTEQPAQADSTPVEPLPDGPMRVHVKMGFDAADMARLKETAAADRAAYLAESEVRRASARAKYGPAPIEGSIVAHQDEAYGCLPADTTNPDVHAAIVVLELCGYEPARLYGDDAEECADATGFWVVPRGGGRVAIYQLVNGQRTDTDGSPWVGELDEYRGAFRTVGWQVERGSVTCVFVHRPQDAEPADLPGDLGFRRIAERALAAAIRAGNVAEVEGLLNCFPAGDRVRQLRAEIIRAAAAERERIGQSRQ
ncbi:hypothetical protein [Kitasatospora sp. GAS1066B]|uniref:hypothetical protein n=1 Tax=Kitasatospora sp. GAS1066B TaxID=3156271 RepID=UPI003512F7B6